MGKYIAEQTIKQIVKLNKPVNGARIGIFGLTFKENCNDIRNTRVIDIIRELQSYHIDIVVHDPLADSDKVFHEYGIRLSPWENRGELDAVILAVSHAAYLKMPLGELVRGMKSPGLVIDVKSVLDVKALAELDIKTWRL